MHLGENPIERILSDYNIVILVLVSVY